APASGPVRSARWLPRNGPAAHRRFPGWRARGSAGATSRKARTPRSPRRVFPPPGIRFHGQNEGLQEQALEGPRLRPAELPKAIAERSWASYLFERFERAPHFRRHRVVRPRRQKLAHLRRCRGGIAQLDVTIGQEEVEVRQILVRKAPRHQSLIHGDKELARLEACQRPVVVRRGTQRLCLLPPVGDIAQGLVVAFETVDLCQRRIGGIRVGVPFERLFIASGSLSRSALLFGEPAPEHEGARISRPDLQGFVHGASRRRKITSVHTPFCDLSLPDGAPGRSQLVLADNAGVFLSLRRAFRKENKFRISPDARPPDELDSGCGGLVTGRGYGDDVRA